MSIKSAKDKQIMGSQYTADFQKREFEDFKKTGKTITKEMKEYFLIEKNHKQIFKDGRDRDYTQFL